MSEQLERLGLPRYDAMLGAIEEASDYVESTLERIDEVEDKQLALRLCAQIVRAFDVAWTDRIHHMGLDAMTRGAKLARKMVREESRDG